jgi:hypothetical protein
MRILKHVKCVDEVELLVPNLRKVKLLRNISFVVSLLDFEKFEELLIPHRGLPSLNCAVVHGDKERANGVKGRKLKGSDTTFESTVGLKPCNHQLWLILSIFSEGTEVEGAVGGAYREVYSIRVKDSCSKVFLWSCKRDTILSFNSKAFNVNKSDQT